MSDEKISQLCYHPSGQKIAVCNYWYDPTQRDLYLKENVYLPQLNNEVEHSEMQRYKDNFLSLKKLVLIGGPDDGTIIPWQAAHYSFWDANMTIVPYNEQQYYKNDSFGLRTLNETGRLFFETRANTIHHAWIHNHTIYDEVIKPYLY